MAPTVREERLMKKLAGTSDAKEKEALKKALEKERKRSFRVREWEPAKKRKQQKVLLDRQTELAVEFIINNLPTVEGKKRMEFSEFHRQLLQDAAQELGWEPPD